MAKRATYRVNADSWTVLRDILERGEDFNIDSASLRGRIVHDPQTSSRNIYTGMLPATDASEMRDSCVSYVIFSYHTPIAYLRVADWNRDGTANREWVIPDVRYSVTTSKHQGKVRTAISQLGV